MPFNEDRLHENHGRFEFYFNISRLADMLPFSRTANVLQQEKKLCFQAITTFMQSTVGGSGLHVMVRCISQLCL